jgi:colanic acid biosynthesis protein WcaH
MFHSLIPQSLYNQILENMPIACVDIAVVSSGKILLVLRKDAPARGQWWLPGGRVLKGEKMRDTARRKAIEEIGIDCHVGPIIHTAETIFPDGPGGIPVHSINSCFLLYPVEATAANDVNLDDHHADCQWVDSISADLDPYVVSCLLGAGLELQLLSPQVRYLHGTHPTIKVSLNLNHRDRGARRRKPDSRIRPSGAM